MKSKKRGIVNSILHIVGFAMCIMPPAICTISYFPLWKESAQALSGGVLLLLIVSAWPLYKMLNDKLKSPSASALWLILFVVFFTLAKIADEMTVISFVGFISNAIGALIFKIADKEEENEG